MDRVTQIIVDAYLIIKEFDALVLHASSAGFLFHFLRNK